MTVEEKVATIKVLLDGDPTADTETVTVYLDMAKSAVLARMYPYGIPETVTEVPAIYEMRECELAARYFSRRGGLGEVTHSENGINRSWGSADDIDILEHITPIAKVV